MASKLVLDFTDSGVIGQTITIRTGVTFTFAAVRNGFHKVEVNDYWLGAKRFKEAYEIDENNTGESVVTYFAHTSPTNFGRVTIEHFDNNFFDGFNNPTTFITSNINLTTQEIALTLDASITETTEPDKCNLYDLNIDSNATSGEIRVYKDSNLIWYFPANTTPKKTWIARTVNSNKIQVRLYQGAIIEKLKKAVSLTTPSVLSITSVNIGGSAFGAFASINATYTTGTQYSLDGINFQDSSQYSGLTEGNYTAYAKDNFGCTKSKDFVVTAEHANGLTVEPFIHVPIHNSIRFANRNGNNFLNYLSTETPGLVELYSYTQDYLQSDVVRTQFKSSYDDNKAILIDCDGVEVEIPIIKLSNNINRTNIYEGNYKSYKGRVAIYFTAGNIYEIDGTPQEEGHILNGLLPVWYKEGMYLFIEGLGATQIDTIEFDEIEEKVFAVTQLSQVGEVTGIKVTSIHTEHPYEVYEFDTNFNLPEGVYQIRLEYGTDFFLSEIIKIYSELPEDYLTVQWYNDRNNDILYNTGIQQLRRLQWEKYFTLIPKSEKETYDTDTSVELVNSKSFSVYELAFRPMPMEVARGLMYGFDNSSSIIINGAVFVCEAGVKIDPIGPLYSFSAELTLTNQTMRGQQVLSNVVDASFLVVEQDANGTGYLLI